MIVSSLPPKLLQTWLHLHSLCLPFLTAPFPLSSNHPHPHPYLLVADSQVALRFGVALIGRLGEPRGCRGLVFGDALAVVQAYPEVALRVGVALMWYRRIHGGGRRHEEC